MHTCACMHARSPTPSSAVGSRRSSALSQTPALCSKEMQQTFKYFQTKQDILKDSPPVASLSAYICVSKIKRKAEAGRATLDRSRKGKWRSNEKKFKTFTQAALTF